MKSFLRWMRDKLILIASEPCDLSSPSDISAYQVHLINKFRYESVKAKLAERNLSTLKEVNDRVIKNAMELDDGEMTPFVLSTVIEIENGMKSLSKETR